MAKKDQDTAPETEVKDEDVLADLKAKDATRPTDDTAVPMLDEETLSHKWQAGSPAVNANVLNQSQMTGNESVLDKIDSPENRKKQYQTTYNTATDQDPSKLDVSDADYAQEGSAKYLAWKNAHGEEA